MRNPFHRHHWKATAVRHGHDGDGYSCTCVLLICKCGEFASRSLYGTWTVEELTPNELSLDQKFLRDMKVKL